MKLRQVARLSNRGASFAEVLVALAIVISMAIMVLPYFVKQRNAIYNYEPAGICQGYLTRAVTRLESGGPVSTEAPEYFSSTTVFTTSDGWKNVPEIFHAPASKRVSFNPQNTRTFGDRFREMGVPTTAAGKYRLYTTRPGTSYLQKYYTLETEADGVLLYTPLLMKGTISDIADLYNNPTYHGTFGPAPAFVHGSESAISSLYTLNVEMKIDRITVDGRNVNQTANKFWPVQRNAFGNTDPTETEKYRITSVENIQVAAEGFKSYTIAQIPQAADGIEMSWDFGYRVSFKGQLTEVASGVVTDCSQIQEYFLPTDFHNVLSFKHDFDFLTPAIPNTPQTVVTSQLSTKFDDLAPMIANPVFLSIFTGTNFGTSASGKPNSILGTGRPECSQSGGNSKTFEMVLRFKNLSKEPGAIPLCMDTSDRPQELKPNGNVKGDYNWCPGAANAQTLIVNEFLPGATGFVPCEKMRFCGQIPDQVKVTTADDGDVEYRYQYTVRNDDNSARRNRLWGCDISYSTAIVDPSGNLSYVPLNTGAGIENPAPILGASRPFMTSIVPKIYFKPPPCQICKCKPKKKGKNPLLKIIAIVSFVALAVFAAPLFVGALSTLPLMGPFAPLIFAEGVIGLTLSIVATCLLQAAGVTGGRCEPNHSMGDRGGDYRSCNSANRPAPACAHGFTCSKMAVPNGPFTGGPDLPPGVQDDTASGYCSYDTALHTSPDGHTWRVQMGARRPDGTIDSSAVLDFTDPNVKVEPGKYYTQIGDVASYSMLEEDLGLFCQVQFQCVWNNSTTNPHGVWQVYVGEEEGGAVPIDRCWKLKVGHELDFQPSGTVSKGAPKCLKIDGDPATTPLSPCSEFDIACYDGSNKHSIGALNLNFGPATNIAGKRTNAKADNFVGYLPVEKRAAKCKPQIAECGTSPCANPPLSGPYSPGDGSTYDRNDTCDPTFTPSTYTLLSCSAGCTPNNPAYGSCSYSAGPPSSCTPNPVVFHRAQFNIFDYWYGCKPPDSYEVHMKDATSGMLCYENYNSSYLNLPLCFESGAPTIGDTKPDMVCPGGLLCH